RLTHRQACSLDHRDEGSFFDADHPATGVLFPRRSTTPDGLRKSVTGTAETVSCQRVARFVGKEFARVGDRSTLYMTMGVRP
ncbi:three component ABC system middle component, partial [Sphingobium xenophagum]